MKDDASITARLLAEIQRVGSTRVSIAMMLHGWLLDHGWGGTEFPDWPSIHRALRRRYTQSGIDYIKRLAWSATRHNHIASVANGKP